MRSLIKVVGAAVKGKSHIRKGMPCQDKINIWRAKDKKNAGIALSDGAGSSPYSQIGAEYSVNAVIPFVKNHFDGYLNSLYKAKIEISEYLTNGLKKVANESAIEFDDLACTLLFVVIRRKKNSVKYIAGHIGDGAIFYEQESMNVQVLSEPERGEYANTTVFLTSKNIKSKLRIYSGILKRPTGFMIMSDGAADTLYIRKTKSPNQIYCKQIFNWCKNYSQKRISQALIKNLEDGVFKEVSSDDCSLSLIKVT